MFLYVCKQTFRISKVRISQKVKGVIMRNLRGTIFYMKTNVLQDFHICISVPLKIMFSKILVVLSHRSFSHFHILLLLQGRFFGDIVINAWSASIWRNLVNLLWQKLLTNRNLFQFKYKHFKYYVFTWIR